MFASFEQALTLFIICWPAVVVERLRYVAFVDNKDFVKFVLVKRSLCPHLKFMASM